MRILIVGAGGIGGYFGGRLQEAGADVTFLLRSKKRKVLQKSGLSLESPLGNWQGNIKTLSVGDPAEPFDIVLLSCKSYDLDSALDAVSGFIGSKTIVLPLLNGLRHLERIAQRQPSINLWGGLVHIGVRAGDYGKITHFNKINDFTLGPLDLKVKPCSQINDLISTFGKSPVRVVYSRHIYHDLWKKFVFLGTLAGMTCLMRADIGTILQTTHGKILILQLLEECKAIAEQEGHHIQDDVILQYVAQLTDKTSTASASMLHDIACQNPTEGNHILGDLLARATRHDVQTPLLKICYTHLDVYEHQRRRVLC
ncbi:MAG: ketopantoate reductase family protein [Terasakiella sp.]|uniref:ketopantoate reductase family protein n=1 Tax=unclassified Terasakiella TaxID=2614952 RepID=UPI003B00F804